MRFVLFIFVVSVVSGCSVSKMNQAGNALVTDSVIEGRAFADFFVSESFPGFSMARNLKHFHFNGEMDVDVEFK